MVDLTSKVTGVLPGANGGTGNNSIVENFGASITEPIPTKEAYTFGGWYTDVALTTLYVFDTMPAEDITLYAKWTETPASDAELVAAAKAWLDLGDLTALTNQSPRLILPTTKDEVSISWVINKTDFTLLTLSQSVLKSSSNIIFLFFRLDSYSISSAASRVPGVGDNTNIKNTFFVGERC